jgi:hypothetical protein
MLEGSWVIWIFWRLSSLLLFNTEKELQLKHKSKRKGKEETRLPAVEVDVSGCSQRITDGG